MPSLSAPIRQPKQAYKACCPALAAIAVLTLSSCAMPPARQAPPAQAVVPPARARSAPPEAPAAAVPIPLPQAEQPAIVPLPEAASVPLAREAALRAWVERQSRIYRVAAPLLINNTELCPQHRRPILGFTAKNRYSFSGDFVEAAQSALGLGDELRVMDVLPGSGAEQAGMRKGDELVAVEIEPAPQGPNAEHAAAALIGEEMQDRDSLHLTLRRDGQRMALDVPLTPACAMVLDLGNSDEARSFSDGRRVMVTSGMLHFVRSDEELAYVLAREIARNALMPDERTDMKPLIDRLHALDAREPGPLPPSASAPLPQADAVDRLALYMLARAGYDIDGFGPFGERLAAHANGTEAARPAAGLGVSALAQAVREVKAKKADGLPLLP